ncbi:unnamed protein product [Rotaria sp. Silwood1]|nr:unnamed protein product [Rotaria sp. Silwood1]CAF5056966.1 unnamed protein product [Rotaria sp. Silwood1]
MGYMMDMISAYYKIESILIAIGIPAFVCLGVTLFSFQTKYDFTSCFVVLFVMLLALLGFGIIMYTVYAGLGAVAFSIFLTADTQLIIERKRHEIDAENHIFVLLMLNIDVVYIFLYILMLIGKQD